MMKNKSVFTGRSLCVIEDFSKEERRYLFEQARILKAAMEAQDEELLSRFRIDDRDYGIYEVFLNDSFVRVESSKKTS